MNETALVSRRFPTRIRCSPVALEDRITPVTFVVTNTLDAGAGSLRNAIAGANKGGLFTDEIVFDPAVFTSAKTITLTSGQLLITDDVNIIGPSAPLTISGNATSRVFEVSGSGTIAVSMSHVTIAAGVVVGPGAGILSQAENLTLTDCTIQGNIAAGANSGGGVSSPGGGTLSLVRCIVTDNQSGGNGGGIDANGGAVVTLTDCTVAANAASVNGGGLGVGSSSLKIERSTVSGNTGDRGGGLYFAGAVGADGLTLLNSTFSGNKAVVNDGGGVAFVNASGTLLIQNSTLTANSAVGAGGGVARIGGSSTLSTESTILQANIAATGVDISTGGVASARNCAIGSLSGIAKFVDLGGNLIGQSIQLGLLTNNGGLTKTHQPAITSPLVSKGSNPASLTTDQRGTGFPRVNGPGIDIGAVETVFIPTPTTYVVTNTADSGKGSLRQAILDANANSPTHDTVTFDPAVFSTAQTIMLITGHLAIQDTCTIQGPGATLLTISGNKSSRLFAITANATISDMSLINGSAMDGAGVYLETAQATLNHCVIAGNSASRYGGGVHNMNGSLVVNGCTLTGNTANYGGGMACYDTGVTSSADALILASSISNNMAAVGGGVFGQSSPLTFDQSTLADNSAAGGSGGGVFFLSEGSQISSADRLTITNCTISSNSAINDGGGIALDGGIAPLEIVSSTLVGNTAQGGNGGGIFSGSVDDEIAMSACVVSDNTNGAAPDISANVVVTTNFCAIGNPAGFNNQGANNLPFGLDWKLGPLANHGGPTLTYLPALDSPLVNAGPLSSSLSTDQRGPGYPRKLGSAVDIGAVEVRLPLVVTSADNGGPGTLRQAVEDANAAAGPDTVNFDPAVFNTAQTIGLDGEITIAESITIIGPGATKASVTSNAGSRLLNVNVVGTGTVSLTGITLANGTAAGAGGAIFVNDDAVILTSCVITGNKSAGPGGAVYVASGALTLTGCTISNNTAVDANGGGIYFKNGGSLLVENSTLSGNLASGGNGKGGGLYFRGDVGAGGLAVRNSTFSGNTGGICSGGIGLENFTGTLVIRNSTIVANTATVAAGGGIELLGGTGTIDLGSSVVAGNFAGTAGAKDISSAGSVLLNYTAVGDDSGFIATGSNNITPLADAKLGPLANNGGATLTHSPLPGSPLIDAGSNSAGLVTDQRGAGYQRVAGPAADIGALEVQLPPTVTSVVINGGSIQRSLVTTVTVTFSEAVTFAGAPAAAFRLERLGPGAPTGIVNLNASPLGAEVVLSFTNGGMVATDPNGSLMDGVYQLIVIADQLTGVGGQMTADYSTPPSGPGRIHRLFGDNDGDGDVDVTDFGAFRSAFGTSSNVFDFDGDGDVDTSDFGQFRTRFGTTM